MRGRRRGATSESGDWRRRASLLGLLWDGVDNMRTTCVEPSETDQGENGEPVWVFSG